MSTPAGWYPDPADGSRIRYWDGSAWTQQVRPSQGAPTPQRYRSPYTTPGGAAPMPVYPDYGVMPTVAQVVPGRRGPDGQVLASWLRRVCGYLLDLLIVAVAAIIASIAAVLIVGATGQEIAYANRMTDLQAALDSGAPITTDQVMGVFGPGFWTILALVLAATVIVSLVNGVILVSSSGQTVGDRIVGTRKVMAGRTVPTFGIALIRWAVPTLVLPLFNLLPVLPVGTILTLIDYLWPLWDGKSQALHDKMVGTYVERADLAGPPVPRR